MDPLKLITAIEEAERFIKRVEELQVVRKEYELAGNKYFAYFPKEQGAVRRASLDLTRALADLRKP